MSNWAENECRRICKEINPDFNFDDDNAFDYTCSCYKSALKAYESLCEDGHSGFSFGATRSILIKLLYEIPLTPITDKDFFPEETPDYMPTKEAPEYLREMGLVSSMQCPRKSSLFRDEHLDGTVTYHDIDRYYCVNVEKPSDTYFTSVPEIDELFPITMPYMPTKEKYEVYQQTFLSAKGKGDFDTKATLYIITPEGKKVEINHFMTEDENGKWKDISREEYEELLATRVDRLNEKVAGSILWTMTSNTGTDDQIECKEKRWNSIDKSIKDEYFNRLASACEFFEKKENYKYNTFDMTHFLCTKDISDEKYAKYNKILEENRELRDIRGILDDIRNLIEHGSCDISENNIEKE